MARRIGALMAFCSVVSACTSDGSSVPDDASIADGRAAVAQADIALTEPTVVPSTDTPTPIDEPDRPTAADPEPPSERAEELLARAGTIDLVVFAPADLVDDVTPVVIGSDGDLFASHCRPDEPFGNLLAERFIPCDRILPGSYRVDVDIAGPVDDSVATGSVCGNEFGDDAEMAEVYVNGSAWCQLYVLRPTLRVFAHAASGSGWDPVIVDQNGSPLALDCGRNPEPDGQVTLVCADIPLGTYELPPQPFADGSVDAPFVCSSLYGDEQLPGVAALDRGRNEFGVPLNFWDCFQEVTEDMLPGTVEFTTYGTPSASRELAPIIRQNGVDIFPTSCEVVEEFSPGTGGVRHRCEDLPRENIDVIIPEAEGARIQLRCDTALAYPSHREVVVDLVEVSTAYCAASRIEPTLAIIMVSDERRPEWNVDEFVIELPTGPVGIGWCDQVEVLDPTYAELWVYCSPVRETTIVVPDQPVVVGGPVERFACSVGIGLGGGPDSDNTAAIAVVNDDGLVPDEWACNNSDNW